MISNQERQLTLTDSESVKSFSQVFAVEKDPVYETIMSINSTVN